MDNAWSLGIDFGTSNTAAAHTNPVKGNVEAVNLSHTRTTMSSSVYLDSVDNVAVGDVARDRASSNPSGFIPSPKRLVPQHVFQLNGLDVPSSIPIAAILKSVLERATREHGGIPPQELVLTHPEAWSEEEINVLLEAAAGLGLSADKIRTVSEPQAAAHYYSQAQTLESGEKIAVFDFGGGTLDVAVLEAQTDGMFNVIAARGDQNLGGKTFDALIRRWVDSQLEDQDPELLVYLREKAPISERHAMEDAIRRAKELLSEASTATINFQAAGETHRIQITRDELETIISSHLDKAVDLTRRTFQEAGIARSDQIKALYLTGGSSRIPLVQEALKPLGPVATLDDPKTVVAQGALSAIIPVITHITSNNTGLTSATAPSPVNAPPASNRNESHSQTASFPAQTTEAVNPNADGKKNKLPIFLGIGVAAIAIVGLGAFALTRGGGNEAPTQAESQTFAEPATSTDDQSNEAAPESTSAAPESTSSARDVAIESIPAKRKSLISSCKEGDVNSTPGAICDVNAENTDAEKYFNFESVGAAPQVQIVVNKSHARSERASLRNTSSFYKEVSFENQNPIAWGIDEAAIADGTFDLTYVNTDTGIYMRIDSLRDVESAKSLMADSGL